jgi:PKD repeat protein
MAIRVSLLALLALSCISMAGCSSGSSSAPAGTTVQVPSGLADSALTAGFNLPAPSKLRPQLAASHRASFVETDLWFSGADYAATLPNQHVAVDGDNAVFSPSFSGATPGFTGLAFAMYGFSNLLDYNHGEFISLTWATSPAATDAFLGLANWDTDSWDWFAIPADGKVSPPSTGGQPFAGYIDPVGLMLSTVVVIGDTACNLSKLRIGEVPPVARFTADPPGGIPPVEITFDASASTAVESTIVKYEWDLDGDGTFELDKGTDSLAQQTYSATGSFTVQLRVTDDRGATDTASKLISTYTEWNHTWGKTLGDGFTAVKIKDAVAYASGYINAGGVYDAQLHAFSLDDGTILWRKQWDSGDSDWINDIAVSQDGTKIYTAGYTEGAGAGSADWLIQAWDPTGTILWTRTLGGAKYDSASAVVLLDDSLFVCGSGRFQDEELSQVAIARFTLDGDLSWVRSWGGADTDVCEAACSIPALLGTATIGLVGRTGSFGAGSFDTLYLRFNQDGDLLSAMTWGDGDVQYGSDICSSLLEGTYICGTDFKSSTQALLVKVNQGTPAFAKAVGSGDSLTASSVLFNGSSLLFTGDRSHPQIDDDLYLGRLELDSLSLIIEDLTKTGNGDYGNAHTLLPGGNILVCGSLDNTNAIAWVPYGGTLTDRTSIPWVNVAQQAEEVNLTALPASVPATNAVGTADTGGGSYDCYLGVHQM